MDVDPNQVLEEAKLTYQLLNSGRVAEAIALTKKLESLSTGLGDGGLKDTCLKHIAGSLIEIGKATQNRAWIQRGVAYLEKWARSHLSAQDAWQALNYYNLANGYSSLWEFEREQCFTEGKDAQEHRQACINYRKATGYSNSLHSSQAAEIWTNYGNALDGAGRCIEAIEQYDRALLLYPQMGMALGNKAIVLKHIAPLMRGHTHRFFLEARRLFQSAVLSPDVYPQAVSQFRAHLAQLDTWYDAHGETPPEPEEVELMEPVNEFHKFLCTFCAQHKLFLNPVTLLGGGNTHFYGDPMFVSEIRVPLEDKERHNRYLTYLNQIKQEYILARYFLVQSQYASEVIDAVDEGVLLFYPLDYSLYSTYIELLKAALRQAVSVLEKVAYFIYAYCELKTPRLSDVGFKSEALWLKKDNAAKDTLRAELAQRQNPFLLALFGIFRDVSKGGEWAYIYEHRHALTHRFVAIHDTVITQPQDVHIERVSEGEFLKRAIKAMQVARAAVMYLILFVDEEEQGAVSGSGGIEPTIYGTPVDGVFRHRPRF